MSRDLMIAANQVNFQEHLGPQINLLQNPVYEVQGSDPAQSPSSTGENLHRASSHLK